MSDLSARPFELPRAGSPGDLLLDRLVDHLLDDGDPRGSLRSLAESIGTSHRMLQYHFGTKERLLGAALLKIMQRMPPPAPDEWPTTRADYLHYAWGVYRRPENFILLELLLMVTNPAAGALNDETLMKQLSGSFRDQLVTLGLREGLAPERANAEARLVIDAWRGLHQDLYGTRDARAVDAAMDVLIEWVTP
ncbi:MAG: TetR/AcrR family transcriptional regulator [Actinomycetota bacterium]